VDGAPAAVGRAAALAVGCGSMSPTAPVSG